MLKIVVPETEEAEPDDNAPPFLSIRDVSVDYDWGKVSAVRQVNLTVAFGVTALIGASGCGKSSFLRCVNRMNDLIPGCQVTGEIEWNNMNVLDPGVEVESLRRTIGMVAQKPQPFPCSIYENVAFGPRIHGLFHTQAHLDQIVEQSLKRADLWADVKNRLKRSALDLSGGQQQRLCIARALATEPVALLMDEPCSALDPVATGRIEELILFLRTTTPIIIATHNLQQAARISRHTVLFHMGEVIESGKTRDIFMDPRQEWTKRYISGRAG